MWNLNKIKRSLTQNKTDTSKKQTRNKWKQLTNLLAVLNRSVNEKGKYRRGKPVILKEISKYKQGNFFY